MFVREDGYPGIALDVWRDVGQLENEVWFQQDMFPGHDDGDEQQFIPGLRRFGFTVELDRDDDPLGDPTSRARWFHVETDPGLYFRCQGYVLEATPVLRGTTRTRTIRVLGTGVPMWGPA